jgi:hypothetical protein
MPFHPYRSSISNAGHDTVDEEGTIRMLNAPRELDPLRCHHCLTRPVHAGTGVDSV